MASCGFLIYLIAYPSTSAYNEAFDCPQLNTIIEAFCWKICCRILEMDSISDHWVSINAERSTVPYNGIILRSSDILSTFGGSKNFSIFKNYGLKTLSNTLSNNFSESSAELFIIDSSRSQLTISSSALTTMRDCSASGGRGIGRFSKISKLIFFCAVLGAIRSRYSLAFFTNKNV